MASPRWSGAQFRNVHPILPGLRDPNASTPTLTEFLCGGERRVPRGPLPSMSPLEGWPRPPGSGLRATWLGHSTVLIEIDGVRVLTDPVWGKRASPSQLAGPKRFQPVPVSLRAMPPVDLVVISHDHYDHLDYPTIHELAKLDLPFVTSLGVGAHLEYWGVRPERIVELDWWESHTLPKSGLTVTADAVAAFFRARAARPQRHGMVLVRDWLGAARGVLQRRHGPHDRISNDPRAPRSLRPRDAGSGRPASFVGRHPPRTEERARGAGAARRRPLHAGALGHVRPRHARVGSAGGDSAGAGPEKGRAARDAALGRTGRAGARGTRRAVVAQSSIRLRSSPNPRRLW